MNKKRGKPKNPKLTLERMMFVQAVLADPQRNLTRAYVSVYGGKGGMVSRNCASVMWKNEVVKAYAQHLMDKSGKVPDIKDVHVEVEKGGEIVIREHGKVLEAIELTQRQLEALLCLHLTTGPSDLLDENGNIKPELSHLVDSYKVRIRRSEDGVETQVVEVKMAAKDSIMKMLWTCRGFAPEKEATDTGGPFKRIRELQDKRTGEEPGLSMR